jgi:aspartate dehydrogenase
MPKNRIGIIGAGTIGSEIAKAVCSGEISGKIGGVYDIEWKKADKLAKNIGGIDPSKDFKSLLKNSDIIVEAASQDAVRKHIPAAIDAGKDVLIMSVGALMDKKLRDNIYNLTVKNNTKVYLPTGAVCGIDAIMAAKQGKVKKITLTTTKPPDSLEGVKYLKDKNIDIKKIKRKKVVYEGSAQEAARLFPKNINVAAIVSISSGSPVKVRIICDPKTRTNNHEIEVFGDFGRITTKTQNKPSKNNPKTSQLAILSAISTLKNINSNVKINI